MKQLTCRHGFSFVEVLFAIAVLGIGFIMIAAIFPVTIRQTQSTMDDSVAAGVARAALVYLQESASELTMPPTAGAVSIIDPSAGLSRRPVNGDSIQSINPRYAWSAMYSRKEGDRFARVFILCVRVRNRSSYVPADLQTSADDTTGLPPNLVPRSVKVSLEKGPSGQGGRLRFAGSDSGAVLGAAGDTNDAAAPGAYIVIANDGVEGRQNGRIYQLGATVDGQGTWDLAPGGDMADASENLDQAQAMMIGRGYVDPARPADGFAGPAQDVAIYVAFVHVQ